MEKEFVSNKYLDQEETSDLAKKLNLDESKVTTWFKNRRNQIFSNDLDFNVKIDNAENNPDPDFELHKNSGLITKGGLISESFSIWSNLQGKVLNH